MVQITLPREPEELLALLESIPDSPAVFLLWPAAGQPYLARTNVLRRRLMRVMSSVAVRLEYHLAGSKLESRFLHLELARQYLGADYRREIRLRLPPYLRLLLSNEFPRTQLAG